MIFRDFSKSFLLALVIVTPSLSFAWQEDCGGGGWCACPNIHGGACLGSFSSCEEACGLTNGGRAASNASSSLSAVDQAGYQLGMMGFQMIGQGLGQLFRGPSPEEVERRRQIVAQQQEQERLKQKTEELKQQQIHDRIVAQLKSDDGSTGGGIKGLPGIYLGSHSDVLSPQQGQQAVALDGILKLKKQEEDVFSLSTEEQSLPVIDPHAVVNPSVVKGAFSDHPLPEDQALMRHQWQMSIDERYLNDVQVQQNIRDLWQAARNGDAKADNKLKTILTDQFKSQGMDQKQIDDFLDKFNVIFTGVGTSPKEWNNAMPEANQFDEAKGAMPGVNGGTSYYGKDDIKGDIGQQLFGVQVKDLKYMGNGVQTQDDCVLHAIANGAQVPLDKVRQAFDDTAGHMGMDSIEERHNPQLGVTSAAKGGNGGLNGPEELLVAEKFGQVIPVPKGSFARAMAATGKPVIATVSLGVGQGNHVVLITGLHQTMDGTRYYSVMDSNLDPNKYKNSTSFVEKSFFDAHLSSGGFIVDPKH